MSDGPDFDHVWWWRAHPPMRTIDRKGQRCRVVTRGGMGSVLVEFEDGFRVLTSRYAVRLDPKLKCRDGRGLGKA